MTIPEPPPSLAPESSPEAPPSPQPARWLRTVTHLVALGWGTLELAMWGARPQAFAFIGLVLLGTEGALGLAKVRRYLGS